MIKKKYVIFDYARDLINAAYDFSAVTNYPFKKWILGQSCEIGDYIFILNRAECLRGIHDAEFYKWDAENKKLERIVSPIPNKPEHPIKPIADTKKYKMKGGYKANVVVVDEWVNGD